MDDHDESHLLGHGPCRLCSSSDAAARYSSGWTHCFSCGENYPTDPDSNFRSVQSEVRSLKDLTFIEGEAEDLNLRGISKETCKKYRYLVGVVPEDYPCSEKSPIHPMKGRKVHIENFFDEDGVLVAQKLRTSDKKFAMIGKNSDLLAGRQAVKPGQKLVVITEGFLDALSYAEVRKGWPALSIPNGADSAKRAILANLSYLESHDKVVLAFDNDDAGRKAVQECKGLLSPGKVFVASLSEEYKDFSEALQEGDVKAILAAIFNAEEVRPDGLVTIDEIMEEAMKPVEWGLPWFFPELTDLTYGRRWGEVYGFGGPTGGGKTDFLTEQISFDVTQLNEKVGVLFLEQKPVESAKRISGKVANRRFHVPDAGWTVDELKDALSSLSGKVVFYDSFGQTDWQEVKTRIRHMALAHGIRIFYVDHLTAMADTKDEKGSLEQIMKELAGVANELSLIIHYVSHLTTPDGTPHEEGGRIAIRHFKGSRSIGFWSYFMFGLERNQQAEDEAERHRTTFRILKDRYTGQATGHTLTMGYDGETGRIIPPSAVDFPKLEEEEF